MESCLLSTSLPLPHLFISENPCPFQSSLSLKQIPLVQRIFTIRSSWCLTPAPDPSPHLRQGGPIPHSSPLPSATVATMRKLGILNYIHLWRSPNANNHPPSVPRSQRADASQWAGSHWTLIGNQAWALCFEQLEGESGCKEKKNMQLPKKAAVKVASLEDICYGLNWIPLTDPQQKSYVGVLTPGTPQTVTLCGDRVYYVPILCGDPVSTEGDNQVKWGH